MKDADIREFAADIAKISNKTIILDPIKGKVTVISDQDLMREKPMLYFYLL